MFGLNYLKLGIAAVIALLIGWHLIGDWKTGHDLKDARALATQLQANLDLQNAAITKLKTDADERLATAQKDLTSAKVLADGLRGKAKIIYKVAPSTPGDLCSSTLQLINGK